MKKLVNFLPFVVAFFLSAYGYAADYHDSIPQQCVNITGGSILTTHVNAQTGAIGNGTLTVAFFGDLDIVGSEFVDVFSEKGSLIGTLATPGAQCGLGNIVFTIPRDSIDVWAQDGSINFNYQGSTAVNSGICSGSAFCITTVLDYSFESGFNNIGVKSILSPGISCAGNVPVTIVVSNSGLNQVDTFSVAWEINGIAQTPQTYFTLLDTSGGANPTDTTIILNPAFNFTATTNFKFWTFNPNNVLDTINQNDTLSISRTPSLAGTFTIGATGNYPNFTAAVNDLIALGICGPVVFNVLPGSGPYNEQITIPQIIGASATNTITFNGNGETITFSTTASPNNYIIRLDGADYITFNNLNITTIAVTNNFAVHLTNNADFNTFNGCKINLSSTFGSTSTLNAGIVLSGSLTSATAVGNSGSNNTFTNDTIIGGYYGVTLIGSSAIARALNNTIENSIIQDFYFYGIYHNQASNTIVRNNSLSRPTRTTLSSFYALYYTSGGENNLAESNKIFDAFNGNTTSTSVAYPIYFTSFDATVGNENKVINNIIYNINHNGTIYGIYSVGSDNVQYYNNTISLDHTAATAGLTRGFYQTTTATGVDFRNNLITINRGGTGVKHAIYLGTTASTVTSNNNTLFMGNPTGTSGYGFYGGNFQTFANWQTANTNAFDQNSVDADPLYANAAGGNFMPTNATAGDFGAALGVLTDLNGTARSVTTPDPGAIEFVPPACPQPSALNIAAFTGFTADLAWTENGTATTWDIEWGLAGFVPTGTPTVTGTTTNPHQISGLTPLTNYEFYVRADCGMPNGQSLWSGPFTFTTGCATQLAGTFTIGATGTYPTFTAAIADLNCGISAPVVFNVLPGSGPYNEQITIPQVLGASSTNTITFNGNGETINFTTTASPNNYIIRLDGADHIIIENLNVVTLGATNNFAIHVTNNADSNIIRNNTVNLTSAITNTSTLNAGIVISGTLTSALGIGLSGSANTIKNNTIIGGYYGITNIGSSATAASNNNVIDSNFVQDFYSYGIYLRSTSQTSITGNQISRPSRTNTTTFYGIYHTTGGERNVYEGNKIFDAYRSIAVNTSTSYGFFFTGVDAAVGFENRVINNMVYNINNNGTLYGLYNSSSDGVQYYHNTISLDDVNSTATGVTRGFYQITTATGIDFRNNLITINRGGTGDKHAVYFGSTASTIASNNNTLFMGNSTGTNGYGFYGSNFQTFANWQTANTNAYDQNSADADPIYTAVNFGNLTPNNPNAGDFGDPTVGVLVDINGAARSATTPDPGAIEFIPPSCPQPTALTAATLSNSASLSWTENGSATTWQIEWDTLGFFQGAGNFVTTTTNPTTISGLTAQGMYTFYVRSICSPGDTSFWAGPFTLTTQCAPVTAAWTDSVETFLATTNATLSDPCWSNSPSGITNQYRWNVDNFGGTPNSPNTGPTGAFSGANYFYTEASNGIVGGVAELITPIIDASTLTVPALEFYYHMFGAGIGSLFVDVFDGTSWITVDSIIGQQQTTTAAPWVKERVILSAFPDTIQIKFRAIKGTTFAGDISIDNISVVEAPTCPEPKFLNVTNLLATQTNFGWTEMGSATNWQIEWGLSGFAQGNGVQISTTTNPFTQFGLIPQTTYDFYVRSICAPGDSSVWVGPFTFTTPCTSFIAPWIDSLETHLVTTNADINECWSTMPTLTTTALRWNVQTGPTTSTGTGPSGAFSGANYFHIETSNGAAGDQAQLISPLIDVTSMSAAMLQFYYHMFGATTGKLFVDVNDGNSWTTVDSIIGQQQTATTDPWALRTVQLFQFSGTIQIRFRGERGTSFTGDISLDDIEVLEDTSCILPTNLTVANISTTGATFGWTENGSATTWNVEYDTTGFVLGTGTSVVSTTNPLSVTNLLPGTTYEFYVQADCGSDSSTWVGPMSFTTPTICNPVLPNDTIVCSADTLVLNAGAGFSSYTWSTGDTTQSISLDTTSLGGNGVYTIFVDVEDTLIGCVGSDTMVVTFSTCVSVKENTENISMQIYPNPSNGLFTVNLSLKNTTDLQIRVTNIQGQEVFVKNNFNNLKEINEQINIGNVKGVYFVNIITNNEIITKKIIVQ